MPRLTLTVAAACALVLTIAAWTPRLPSVLASESAAPAENPPSGPALERIALGSCIRQDQPQPIWDAVLAFKPQLFLMLGDNIYGDTDDMAVMRRKYGQLDAVAGFAKLRETCPVVGTWDDHDYGRNDAGREFGARAASQQVMLDFFRVPEDSPRRKREGVYHAQVFGPQEQSVQVILLDTRYHRGPLQRAAERRRGVGPYTASDADEQALLGEAQWTWLEAQLRKPAKVRILASSIQLIADEHGWETWGNLPKERDRLYRLIRDTKAAGVIVVSGDRHRAELSMRDDVVGYPLYDLTSSAMNQSSGSSSDANAHRVGKQFGWANFGSISIDWSQADPLITLSIQDVKRAEPIRQTVKLSELQPADTEPVESPTNAD